MMTRPKVRSDFLNVADELNYLSDMIRYFVCKENSDSKEAATFLQRFGELLKRSGSDDGSIILQDHWALYQETLGDIPNAIRCREREIELIERLFAIGGPVDPINRAFLIQTMQSLARDYLQQGELERANQLLHRIEEL